MTMLRKWLGSAAIAAMLATSSAPALARPGHGWGGYHGGYGHGYGHGYGYRHGGDGFGNFLLGAIVAGGLVAAISSASTHDNRVRNSAGGYDDRPADAPRNWSDAENDAANVCADAAESVATKRGIDAKVDNIDQVDRDGEGYRVDGRLEGGRTFNCGIRNGELSFIQFDDRVAYQ